MTFEFNPHRHVKIWISKDPNTFLPLQNQLRLIRMRELNLTDAIHFVYDAHLLSAKALDELQFFCKKYAIEAHDVNQLVQACTTPEEINLVALYQTEISSLDVGGNLAVASDVLRWLSPIYSLGTYSDFDVNVDTRGLKPTITVKSDMLLNIGSVDMAFGIETMIINNDILAVVDSTTALPKIQAVQRLIYDNCAVRSGYDSPYSQFNERKEANLNHIASIRYEKFYRSWGMSQASAQKAAQEAAQNWVNIMLSMDQTYPLIKELARQSQSKNALELRADIHALTKDNLAFSTLFSYNINSGESVSQAASILRQNLKLQLNWMNWFLLPSKRYNCHSAPEFWISSFPPLLTKIEAFTRKRESITGCE